MIKIEIHPAKGKAKGQFYMVIVNGKQRLVNETVINYKSCLKSAKSWQMLIAQYVSIWDYKNGVVMGYGNTRRNMTKKEINRYKNA